VQRTGECGLEVLRNHRARLPLTMTLGDYMSEIATTIVLLVLILTPSFVIFASSGFPMRKRIVWAIAAILPFPLAITSFLSIYQFFGVPAAGLHSDAVPLVFVIGFICPWAIVFKFRVGPNKSSPNNASHADARDASQLSQVPLARAGERERWWLAHGSFVIAWPVLSVFSHFVVWAAKRRPKQSQPQRANA
jgi:hypothetical protein